MTSTVTVIDRGAEATLRACARATDSIDVGVLGDEGSVTKETGITVADVATWAELGLGQPQRSWLRGFITERGPDIEDLITSEMTEVIKLTRTKRQALMRISVWLVGEIQQRIADGIDPPNAESTIEKKGSDVPLIDTGQLRSSITSRINESK